MYDEAIREADIAIAKYGACEEPEYADWAQMNKGRALCSLGRLDEASKVLEDYLAYRELTFGVMDTESHKSVPLHFSIDSQLTTPQNRPGPPVLRRSARLSGPTSGES